MHHVTVTLLLTCINAHVIIAMFLAEFVISYAKMDQGNTCTLVGI